MSDQSSTVNTLGAGEGRDYARNEPIRSFIPPVYPSNLSPRIRSSTFNLGNFSRHFLAVSSLFRATGLGLITRAIGAEIRGGKDEEELQVELLNYPAR